MQQEPFASVAELVAAIEKKLAEQPPPVDEELPPLDHATLEHLMRLLDEAHRFVDFLHKRLFVERSPVADATAEMANGKTLLQTFRTILAKALTHPESLARHYASFAGLAIRVLQGDCDLAPNGSDRRFRDDMWRSSAFYRGLLQLYLAWKQTMQSWLDEQDFDERDHARVQFILDQLAAALAPSNLPINPAALRRAENSQGASAVRGLHSWVDDILHNNGMPRNVARDAYTIGVDLATTPGSVVFRNEQLELIQYAPQTKSVHWRPVLIIPPQINKYYVFDLRPQNSPVAYMVKRGFQVFAISWKTPTHAERDWGLDTYVRAMVEALEAMREITKSRTAGAVSACAGAYTAMAFFGYLAERRELCFNSHSLMVTSLLDNVGSPIELFATVDYVEHALAWARTHGVMEGRDLANIFRWLRPDELIWMYWVNNYLMGRKPPALDLLFWDNDNTRLTGRLHCDFIEMYVNRVYERPRAMTVLGEPIDFRKVRIDTYFAGGIEDYLMPWKGVYRTARALRGNHEFILTQSGHVQSMLRPPNLANTEYFTNTSFPADPDAWRSTATRHDGSWWLHWLQWLETKSGRMRRAPSSPGSSSYPGMYPAPGRYVQDRAN
jgi:polyhydroxyalkanoate synthase